MYDNIKAIGEYTQPAGALQALAAIASRVCEVDWPRKSISESTLSVDAFHAFKGRVEKFRIVFLDSRTRCLPPQSNTQSGEQQLKGLTRFTRSLNYMSQGMHEMRKSTHWNLRRQAPSSNANRR